MNGDVLTLNLYIQNRNVTSMSLPRVYLLQGDTVYDLFKLLSQETTFDMGVSKYPVASMVPFIFEMSSIAGTNALNAAGAKYGTGYCDAQCPKQNFVNGGVSRAPT